MTRRLYAFLVVLLGSAVSPWTAAQNANPTLPACTVHACWSSQQTMQQYEQEHGCSFGSQGPVCLIAQDVCGQEEVAQYGLGPIRDRLDKVAAGLDDPRQAATCASQKSGLEQLVDEMTNAFVSGDVYNNAKGNELPSYIERISNNDAAELSKIGLKPKDLKDDTSRFFASVYYNTRTQQYVVANRGTVFSQMLNPFAQDNSVITDVRQALGYPNDQYDKDAVKLATAIRNSKSADIVTFTGHSLGGSLAALEATIAGGTAMTFDAAGISSATLKNDNIDNHRAQGIENYYVSGEILHEIQGKTLAAATACARSGGSALTTNLMLRYIAWYAGVDYDQGIRAVLPTAMGGQTAIPYTTWVAGTKPPGNPNDPGNASASHPINGTPGHTNSERVAQPQTGTCLGNLKEEGLTYHRLDVLIHGLNYQLTQLLCH